MTKYLVTISWQDDRQPLLRHKETLTADIENIGEISLGDILYIVKLDSNECHSGDDDIAIDFMMELK